MERTSTPQYWNKDSILRVINREIAESIATKQALKTELIMRSPKLVLSL